MLNRLDYNKNVDNRRSMKINKLIFCLCFFFLCILFNTEFVNAATKSLKFDSTWVRGEDIDSSGYNEYVFSLKQSGLVTLNIIRYDQMYTDIMDENYNILFSISNASCSRSNPSSVERSEYFDAGTYILKIKTTNGQSAQDIYDIKATIKTVNNSEKEPNTAYTQANIISANKSYTGVIAVGDEADWYKITVKEGIYTFHMTTYGSIYYNLYGNNLVNEISHNAFESGGDNITPGIINTDIKLSTGIYYLRVVSVNNSAKYIMSFKNLKIPTPKLKTVKNVKGKKMSVRFTSTVNLATGYQIRYSTKKSMKSAKKRKITNQYTTTKTIGKLKKKKIYYVQVRTYFTKDDVTIYSKWSNVKKVKIKK